MRAIAVVTALLGAPLLQAQEMTLDDLAVEPELAPLVDDEQADVPLEPPAPPTKPPEESAAPVAVVAEKPALFGAAAGFGLSLRADVGLLNARTLGVSAAAGAISEALTGDGAPGFSGGVLVQVAWHLPLEHSPLDRLFGAELDVGYAMSGTNGEIALQQYESAAGQTRLVTTTYAYEGLLHSVPISLGLRARLPLELPLHVDVAAGGLALWGTSTTTSTLAGSAVPFSQDNFATDFAWGFYVEGGIALALGVGELTAAYRYQSAYLDFDHPDFNPSLGDLGGNHVLVGYRFLL